MPAPTATIVGPLVYPGNSRKVAVRSVTARCVGPNGAVLRDSDGGIVGETTVFTDTDGLFSLPLVVNSDIDEASGVGPPGTYWSLTVGVRPAVSWLVRLDAADADATVVIGDAAHTVVDPTPRGWVPLIGPGGDKGDAGNAATVAVGAVTTGAPGSSAAVNNSGTSAAAVLDITIPRGDQGDPLVTRMVHRKDGTTPWAKVSITRPDSDSEPARTLSVSGDRLRVSTAAGNTDGNRREAYLTGNTFADGEIRAVWYPPSIIDPDICTPQMGLVLRGGTTGAVVFDQNISGSVFWQTWAANWSWPSGGSSAIPTIGASAVSPTGGAGRSPVVRAVQRLAGTPGTNYYFVDNVYEYAIGDKITWSACSDSTYNGTLTITNIVPSANTVIPSPAIACSDASHTSASAFASAIGVGNRPAPDANNGYDPRQIYPFRVALRVVGKVATGKLWAEGKPEPRWDDPYWAATIDMTSDAVQPAATGKAGVLVNHLRGAGQYVEYGDIEIIEYV